MPENQPTTLRLSDLKTGDRCMVIRVLGHGGFRKRIIEIGFVKNKIITVIKNAPMQDPIEYEIMGYHLSLRRSEAAMVEVVSIDEDVQVEQGTITGFIDDEKYRTIQEKSKTINIALVGNPNSGKTTLFNAASGAREHVGNYAGVTVDLKTATLKHKGYIINITDLPGTYSITGYTPEEMYVQQHLLEAMPDVVVNVVDASNLNRNLFLTTQLLDVNIRVVIALNMYDELEKSGAHLAYNDLSKMIGMPIVPTVAKREKGLSDLFDKVIDAFEDKDPDMRHVHINYGEDIENAIAIIQPELRKNTELVARFSSRFLAIRLLENEKNISHCIAGLPNTGHILQLVEQQCRKLEYKLGDTVETMFTDAKYGFITGALEETYQRGKKDQQSLSTAIDTIITHKYLGIPVLIFFLWVMFQTTFSLGSYPMHWLEAGFTWLASVFNDLLPLGIVRDLLVDGLIGGIGGVLVFLPNILILFFFISLMEDSGYMARAAFIMDKVMHKIGLHGKSFIPLLMGFGCNVPAVMATRTLESRKDRLLTMLITPFMSCSARLPVYVLFIAAFFPKNQGLVLFSIYLIGILLAVFSALLLKKTVFKAEEAPFVMELPPYRMPTLKNTTRHMWNKGVQYLQKMGSIILIASVVIWALNYYPANKTSQDNSYLGQIGKLIEPAMQPLGFDWKMGVSVLSGLAAKEIVVSSMGILYHAEDGADENSASLKEKLQQQTYLSGPREGEKVFNPLVAYSFMLFTLVYFPCIAVIAAIKKEGGWKFAIFSMSYNTILAWILSFIVFQIGSLF